MRNKDIRLAIAGLGAIGLRVAKAVDSGKVAGVTLTAVSANDREAASERVAGFSNPPQVLPLSELADHADVIVDIECPLNSMLVRQFDFFSYTKKSFENGRLLLGFCISVSKIGVDKPY